MNLAHARHRNLVRLGLLLGLMALLLTGLPAVGQADDAQAHAAEGAALRLPAALPGDRVLLMEATAEDHQLWSVALDGSDRRQLTSGGGDFAARWSPDGARVAFHRGGAQATEPWVADADGMNQRQLAQAGFSPAWSPDGREVVFSTSFAGSPGPLISADILAGSRRDVPGTEGAVDPEWSPAGDRIAFVRSSEGAPEPTVGVVRPDGSGLRDIGVVALTGSPVWAPEGTRFAFAAAPAGQPYGLYTANREGEDLRLVARTFGGMIALEDIGDLAWSPDGGRIAFSADAPGGGSRDLYLVGRDGGDIGHPTPSAQDDRVAGWTADGAAIVFTRFVDGSSAMADRDVRQVRLDEAPATRAVTTTGRSVASDVGPGLTLRVAGPDRISTALQLSGLRDAADTVVIARADAYPDALAGAPLAAVLDAPVLLTGSARLDARVAAEVERLGVSTAYLLGGEAALSPAVVDDLQTADVTTIRRLEGADRFGTAAAVAEEVIERTGARHAYVVEGINADPARGWPDAVAVSGLAALEGRPILLVTQGSLPAATRDALTELDTATIVGGTGAVSTDVEAAVAEAVGAADLVDRIAGATRYATSAALADRAVAAGADGARPWLATGRNWPDALAAGPVVAADGGVLLLVDGQGLAGSPSTRDRLATADVARAVIVGGAAVVTPGARVEVERLLRPGDVEVSVFFNREDREPGDVVPVSRTVQGPAVLEGAIAALLEGPTAAERTDGFWSWFSGDTAGFLRSARIEDGTAFLDFDDFRDIIPNASTSAGSIALLGELDETATQFASVDEARYSFLGDEETFYNWLQRSPPE